MTSLIRSAQNDTSQSPNMDGGGTHKMQHLTEQILMTDRCKERESHLFSRMEAFAPVDDVIPMHTQAALSGSES